MKYVPAVPFARRQPNFVLEERMKLYDFRAFLTADVVGCAKSLLAIEPFDPDVLGMPRALLSDALRDAGCEDPEVHDAIDGWSSTISTRIIQQHKNRS